MCLIPDVFEDFSPFGLFQLIKWMILPDEFEKPSAKDVLNHPMFWSESQVFQYFSNLLNQLAMGKVLDYI